MYLITEGHKPELLDRSNADKCFKKLREAIIGIVNSEREIFVSSWEQECRSY